MRTWEAVLEGPYWDALSWIYSRLAKHSAEVICNGFLDCQVLLELVIVLNDLVPPSFQVVDEWTCALGEQRLAVILAEEVGAVLRSPERAP